LTSEGTTKWRSGGTLFPLRLQQDPWLGQRLLAPRGLVPQPCFGRSENGQASRRACRTASADDACNWALARAASDRGALGGLAAALLCLYKTLLLIAVIMDTQVRDQHHSLESRASPPDRTGQSVGAIGVFPQDTSRIANETQHARRNVQARVSSGRSKPYTATAFRSGG